MKTATESRDIANAATNRKHKLRVVVFGANGLAGRAICRKFEDTNFDVYEVTHDMCNATQYGQVGDVFTRLHRTPDIVVNCIAYSSVDLKSNEEANKSYFVNVVAPYNIGTACIRFKVPLFIHISTDYVFNRYDNIKIREDCQRYSPSNVYGQHKLDADMALVGIYDNWNFRNEDDPLKLRIVRTSSLYGPDRNTFVDYVVDEYLKNGTIKALYSGSSVPTSTRYLAEFIYHLSVLTLDAKEDILNYSRYFKNCVCLCGMENISRYVFAGHIVAFLRDMHIPGSLTIERARDCDFTALRPVYSTLEPSAIGEPPPDWYKELKDYLYKKLDKIGLIESYLYKKLDKIGLLG